jgi:hypothetical protein
MKQSALSWLVPSIFILWLFFVLATFFVVQKPFTGVHALAAGRAFLDLAVAGWVAVVGWGLGVGLLQWLLPAREAPEGLTNPDLTGESTEEVGKPSFEASVLGTGLGLGIVGLLSLAVGTLGLFRPVVIYTLMGLLSLGLLGWFWRHRPHWQFTFIDQPDRWTALYLALIALLGLLWALLPPADWDGLFYHLAGPKLYLQAGGIIGGINVPHFNFPSLMEMLFAWTMLLRGDIAAKLLHLVFGLLLTGLVYLTAHRLLEPKAGWRAVTILASMPMLITLASWAYNDLALAFYQLASIYSIINYQLVTSNGITSNQQRKEQSPQGTGQASKSEIQNLATGTHPVGYSEASQAKSKIQNHSWLILSGIFAGLAMGMKYTSFVTPVVVVFLILGWGIKKRETEGRAEGQGGGGAEEQRSRGAVYASDMMHNAPGITPHASRFAFYVLHFTFQKAPLVLTC